MPKVESNIFISWSGERSRFVACALREWIPMVVQAAEPFMSEADVDKGPSMRVSMQFKDVPLLDVLKIFSQQTGINLVASQDVSNEQAVTLYFEDDKLSFLEGDVISSLRRPTEELKQPAKIVDVPDSKSRRRSLVDRVIDALPVVGDDGPRKRTPDRSEEDTQDEDEQETGDES